MLFENGRVWMGAVGVVLLTAAIGSVPEPAEAYRSPFGHKPDHRTDRTIGRRGAHRLYQEIRRAYLAGDYETVRTQARRFMDRYSADDGADRVLYTQALANLADRRYSQARSELLRLKSFYPQSGLMDQSDLSLGDTFFQEGRGRQAIQIWKEALSEYPATSYRVLYLDRLARAYQREGDFDKARRTLDEISAQYPRSLEARTARRQLEAGAFHFTVQVGSFSSQANARKLLEELSQRGVSPYLSQAADGARTFYRVRVGQFATKTEAELEASRLRSQGYLTQIYP